MPPSKLHEDIVDAFRKHPQLATDLPFAGVATWAAKPIPFGPGCTFTPVVIGPSAIPKETRPDKTRAVPELGLLAAHAHPNDIAVARAARAGAAALLRVDDERAKRYYDSIMGALSEQVRARLEEEMRAEEHGYEYQSEFARKYFGAGHDAGKQEGREEGREEGRALEAARAVLAVLAARDMAVPDGVRARIEACTDLELLERWLKRAITAPSAAEVVAE